MINVSIIRYICIDICQASEMAALYTDNIQKLAKWLDYLLGEDTMPSDSRLGVSNINDCLLKSR